MNGTEPSEFATYPVRHTHIWTRTHALIGLAFTLPLLFAYAWTLPGGVGWWDSGELLACSKSLSIAHRPGFPLYMIFGRVMWGAVENPCVLANTFSALCAVLALLFIWRGFCMLWRSSIGASLWLALGGWLVGFSPLFWRQSIRTEVYAPVYMLLALTFLLSVAAQRAPDPRYALRRFWAAAYVLGLAFCLHGALAAALVPVFLYFFLAGDFRPAPRQWLGACLAGLVGLSVYLYVPLRAPHALYLWGDPSSWSGFWTYLTASDAYGIIAAESGGTLSRALGLFTVLQDHTSWLLVGGGVCGLALSALFGRRFGRAPLCLLLAGVLVAATIVSHIIDGNFDMQAYLFPMLWALWWGFGHLNPTTILMRLKLPPRLQRAGGMVGLAVLLPIVGHAYVTGTRSVEASGLELADKWGHELLLSAQDGDLIVIQDANTDFLLRGIQASQPSAPDVAVLNTALSAAPWYRRWWQSRFAADGVGVPPDAPEWDRRVAAWWRSERGTVWVDYGTPGWLAVDLTAAGWLARWDDNPEPAARIPRVDIPVAGEDPDWVRTAVWFYYRLGDYYRARGMTAAADRAWLEGLEWAPDEPGLVAARAELVVATRTDSTTGS